ncbi:vomeronasal type-1 receptor 4-like [Tupaia chinensis]|uniref:vomeronasal type-1 receptor 4-like n=1 Tax=Tupaia chinensis TaxID=246437 RepID=UPI0003C8F407|nr:vomeronasal type-1 receptor 4-like [Tupaia chinensis]
MAASDVTIGMIFFLQTTIGVWGNFSLLFHHMCLYFSGYRLKSPDLIIKHLIVANFLTLLCKGVPQTMAAFGLRDFISDLGCKLLSYLHRVGRSVSIGSTCLLSVLQAVTISPRNSRWAELKVKDPKYTGFFIFLSWILSLLVNIIFLSNVTSKWCHANITMKTDPRNCSAKNSETAVSSLYAVMLSLPDVVYLGLMLWASSSMVVTLHRHKQQVQHIRRPNVSPRSSAESKATKTILLVVSTFVSFYALSCIFQVFLTFLSNCNKLLVSSAAITNACFPTISPFLLKSRDSSALMFCLAWIKNKKVPNLKGDM